MMISSFGQVIVISKIAIINAMAEWHHGNVIINGGGGKEKALLRSFFHYFVSVNCSL